jgi:hypothetical protein
MGMLPTYPFLLTLNKKDRERILLLKRPFNNSIYRKLKIRSTIIGRLDIASIGN